MAEKSRIMHGKTALDEVRETPDYVVGHMADAVRRITQHHTINRIITSPWTWIGVAAAGAIAAYPIVAGTSGWLVRMRGHETITLSDLTVNLIITLAVVGWYVEKMAWIALDRWIDKKKVWGAAKRRAVVLVMCLAGLMALLMYLKLWGYELRF